MFFQPKTFSALEVGRWNGGMCAQQTELAVVDRPQCAKPAGTSRFRLGVLAPQP